MLQLMFFNLCFVTHHVFDMLINIMKLDPYKEK